MISELSAHSTPLPIGFRTWLWRYACLLLMSMLWQRQAIFESKGGKLSSSAECRIRSQGLWNRISSRLNAHLQTNWAIDDQAKNLNSIGRSHGQRAFSPLAPTAGWLQTWLWPYTCLLLLISMLWHRQAKETSCLTHMNPGFVHRGSGTESLADWVPNDWAIEGQVKNIYCQHQGPFLTNMF